MELLPDRLKELWGEIEAKRRHADDYELLKDELFSAYRSLWADAILTGGHTDLRQSMLAEMGRYAEVEDLTEIERRCRRGPADLTKEWDEGVDPTDRKSVEAFYNRSGAEIYCLLWWHALVDDLTPLAYVVSLEFANQRGCRTYMDFGSGVGSGALLFGRHGFDVTCADISSPMLDFCRFRLTSRGLAGRIVNLNHESLPAGTYDFVTAMDVFEHLYNPVEAVERLWRSLRPGGYLMGRWAVEEGDDRRAHIVRDFSPTFARMRELGMAEVWRDDWVWGHQIFQKT
jgi:SAM-dependent methyltransferase